MNKVIKQALAPLLGLLLIISTVGSSAPTANAANPWTPAELETGLSVWLDAADNETVQELGGLVYQWDDKSGNERHATQGVVSGQGTYIPGTEVQLGSNKYMQAPDVMPLGSGGRQVYAVISGLPANSKGFISQELNTWSPGKGFRITGEPAVRMNRRVSYGGGAITSADTLVAVTYDAGSLSSVGLKYAVNGSDRTVAFVNPVVLNADRKGLFLGADYMGSGVNPGISVSIKEVVVTTNDTTSIAEREKMEGYLAWKWGLQGSLPATHAYASAAPIGAQEDEERVGASLVFLKTRKAIANKKRSAAHSAAMLDPAACPMDIRLNQYSSSCSEVDDSLKCDLVWSADSAGDYTIYIKQENELTSLAEGIYTGGENHAEIDLSGMIVWMQEQYGISNMGEKELVLELVSDCVRRETYPLTLNISELTMGALPGSSEIATATRVEIGGDKIKHIEYKINNSEFKPYVGAVVVEPGDVLQYYGIDNRGIVGSIHEEVYPQVGWAEVLLDKIIGMKNHYNTIEENFAGIYKLLYTSIIGIW